MKNEASSISERELAEKVQFLKNQGLGYRRIGKRLGISKDRAFRLDHKYMTTQEIDTGQEIMDQEIAEIGGLEIEIKERIEIAGERTERKWRLKSLLVQEADSSFERRQELFEDKMALLDFTQKVIPLANPALWLRLKKVCKIFEISAENALQEAIGPQEEYEETRMESLDDEGEYPLDQHLCLCLRNWLSEQEEQIVEASVTIEGGKREEKFKLQLPSRVLKHQ